jgi:hypothetical protein
MTKDRAISLKINRTVAGDLKTFFNAIKSYQNEYYSVILNRNVNIDDNKIKSLFRTYYKEDMYDENIVYSNMTKSDILRLAVYMYIYNDNVEMMKKYHNMYDKIENIIKESFYSNYRQYLTFRLSIESYEKFKRKCIMNGRRFSSAISSILYYIMYNGDE